MRPSTIWIVFSHPSIVLELARQRQRELVADAERRRLVERALGDEAAGQARRPAAGTWGSRRRASQPSLEPAE